MLKLTSDIEGKKAFYGHIREPFEKVGFQLSGGWEYNSAMLDAIIMQNDAASIYLRLPVNVIKGKLDREDAYLHFGQPFLIKHVVHTGFVEEDFKALDLVGLNQFQPPKDPDDYIEHEGKWRKAGEKVLKKLTPYLQ